jgi:hypothetical protein
VDSQTIEQFADLFEGRKDAYGLDEGKCWRPIEGQGKWLNVVLAHLDGAMPIGVYPVANVQWCRWGCVDLDQGKPGAPYTQEAEAQKAAVALLDALDALGIRGWNEVTRSGGRHVWVFAETWVPAATMRRALLVACEVAEVSTKEVNPKQEMLAEGQLGNYVRLPYPGDAPNQWILSAYGRMDLEPFVMQALEWRTPSSVLEEAAALYKPPRVESIQLPSIIHSELSRDIIDKLNGLAFTIWLEGPMEGQDRSSTLFKLGCEAWRSGLDAGEVIAVIADLDQRLGKYAQRHDAEFQYQKLASDTYLRVQNDSRTPAR